ncbi:hypothetical protein HXX76_014330 [Chlamydomonas incerta]|uniref:Uncharacterized protein n=1 Tax=Chlamydomonas incerta TaxID=51695 RepID=A0A835SPU8_CHLIN|nr:hypothetical protein HXX76_014330 [Chlamydomonas incerta]|eukprot:KAG2424605.1 hypothetical protein HXX76_014330 [Chlamydomonas incerta]
MLPPRTKTATDAAEAEAEAEADADAAADAAAAAAAATAYASARSSLDAGVLGAAIPESAAARLAALAAQLAAAEAENNRVTAILAAQRQEAAMRAQIAATLAATETVRRQQLRELEDRQNGAAAAEEAAAAAGDAPPQPAASAPAGPTAASRVRLLGGSRAAAGAQPIQVQQQVPPAQPQLFMVDQIGSAIHMTMPRNHAIKPLAAYLDRIFLAVGQPVLTFHEGSELDGVMKLQGGAWVEDPQLPRAVTAADVGAEEEPFIDVPARRK